MFLSLCPPGWSCSHSGACDLDAMDGAFVYNTMVPRGVTFLSDSCVLREKNYHCNNFILHTLRIGTDGEGGGSIIWDNSGTSVPRRSTPVRSRTRRRNRCGSCPRRRLPSCTECESHTCHAAAIVNLFSRGGTNSERKRWYRVLMFFMAALTCDATRYDTGEVFRMCGDIYSCTLVPTHYSLIPYSHRSSILYP